MVSATLCLALVLLAVGSEAVKWKQCGGQNYVSVNKLDISPIPMKFPGKISFTFDATIKQVLNGSDATITIKRSTFLGYIRVPCLFEVGSCTYKDTCTLPKRMMGENWGGITGPIVTQVMDYFGKSGAKLDCPLPKQNILLDKVELKLPTIPTYMTFLASGDYQVQVLHKDKRDGKTIMCIDMDFSIA